MFISIIIKYIKGYKLKNIIKKQYIYSKYYSFLIRKNL